MLFLRKWFYFYCLTDWFVWFDWLVWFNWVEGDLIGGASFSPSWWKSWWINQHLSGSFSKRQFPSFGEQGLHNSICSLFLCFIRSLIVLKLDLHAKHVNKSLFTFGPWIFQHEAPNLHLFWLKKKQSSWGPCISLLWFLKLHKDINFINTTIHHFPVLLFCVLEVYVTFQ